MIANEYVVIEVPAGFGGAYKMTVSIPPVVKVVASEVLRDGVRSRRRNLHFAR